MTPLLLFKRVSYWSSADASTIPQVTILQVKFPNVEDQLAWRIFPCATKSYGFGRLCFSGALFILTVFLGIAGCHRGSTPEVEAKISFTQVPQATSGDQNQQDVIEGTISGTRPEQRLVVYSKTGGLWWLQPLLTSPFTAILPGGVWRNEAHLGTDYAVILVEPSYHPEAVLDHLPHVGRGVASVAFTPGQEKSSSHFIDFSGFTWRVRFRPSDRGGTVNPYVPENVHTDAAGALHMTIVNRDGVWTCSEVNLTRSLGYGTYSFVVEDISKLDISAMFGIFTWDYSTDRENHREFDIDISRWGQPERKNAEFVVQPALLPVNSSRFEAPAGKLKHTVVWEPGRITMTTFRMAGTTEGSVVSRHVFTTEVPTPGSESLRLTLYAYQDPNHKAPRLQHSVEVIVDGFEFLP